jgi:hypothetical protein
VIAGQKFGIFRLFYCPITAAATRRASPPIDGPMISGCPILRSVRLRRLRRGPRGEQGPPVVVPQLIGSRINESYELVFSDSSKEVIPLRPAFERYHRETSE